MIRPFELAAKIKNPWSLAAFAIAALVYFASRDAVPTLAWVAPILIVFIAIVAPLYVELKKTISSGKGIYRVRVTVVNPSRTPIDDATVWSSMGGEPKKVAGGWQFDIPANTKPMDGRLTVFATKASAYLSGQQEIRLSDDFNPSVTIQLSKDTSGRIRGMVVDDESNAMKGARVSIIGYGEEGITTKQDGSFVLPAHAAVNESVQLHAEKDGYQTVNRWHPAGDEPVTIVLKRNRPDVNVES